MTHLEQTASPGTERGRIVVKPLEWGKPTHSGDRYAESVVGQYGVGIIGDRYSVILRTVKDGQDYDEVISRRKAPDLDAALRLAQADYERRILSALESPNLIAAAPTMLEALKDALSGWRYIRDHHGDLYGVGWDRVEHGLNDAIALAEGRTPTETKGGASDERPAQCRFRLQDEGKPYPRSSCTACGKTITTGLGPHCTATSAPAKQEPTGSLVGDALAAAGQSIGMSVTRVHPASEKVGEAVGWETPTEWGLETRVFDAANNSTVPLFARTVITDLWQQYCLAAAPAAPPVADARRVEELERALREAVRGLEMIHGSLMRNGPKQASGELTAHWLETTRAVLKGDSNGH